MGTFVFCVVKLVASCHFRGRHYAQEYCWRFTWFGSVFLLFLKLLAKHQYTRFCCVQKSARTTVTILCLLSRAKPTTTTLQIATDFSLHCIYNRSQPGGNYRLIFADVDFVCSSLMRFLRIPKWTIAAFFTSHRDSPIGVVRIAEWLCWT